MHSDCCRATLWKWKVLIWSSIFIMYDNETERDPKNNIIQSPDRNYYILLSGWPTMEWPSINDHHSYGLDSPASLIGWTFSQATLTIGQHSFQPCICRADGQIVFFTMTSPWRDEPHKNSRRTLDTCIFDSFSFYKKEESTKSNEKTKRERKKSKKKHKTLIRANLIN